VALVSACGGGSGGGSSGGDSATVVSIAITPDTASMHVSAAQAFTAAATMSDASTRDVTSSVTWTVENAASTNATISAAGLFAAGTVAGTVTVTATYDSESAEATVTVTPATLQSIAVTPVNQDIALGLAQQYTATGTYNDNSSANVTPSVTWSEINGTGSASINTTGMLSTVGGGQGSVTVKAALGSVSGSTTANVVAPVLQSITVTPSAQTTALGLTQQYTATGNYSDGSTSNLTSSATWSVINGSGSAAINSTGLLSTSSGTVGSITVKAVSGSTSGTTSATVGAAQLVSIAVTPATPSVPLGLSQQFTATGTYTDGSHADLTSSATWSGLAGTGSGSLSPGGNLTTNSGTQGTYTVTATSGSVSGNTTATIAPPQLQTITVTPATPTIALGNSQQFTATGNYSDSSTQNLTSSATWSAINGTGSATMGVTGLLSTSGGAQGTVTAQAVYGGVTGNTVATVGPPTLVSLAVTPVNQTVALGLSQQYTATGTFTDGSQSDQTSNVTWSVTNGTGAATITTGGSLTTTSGTQGTVTVVATLGLVTGNTGATVGPPVLQTITVTPANPTVNLGGTQQFTATGNYSDSSQSNLTSSVTWTRVNGTGSATINSSGVLSTTGGSQGTVTVYATLNAVSGNTVATVGPPALVSIVVTPPNPTIALGNSQQFTATGFYSDSSHADLTSSVTWSEADGTGSASLSAGGNLTTSGGTQGTVTVTATQGSVSGHTTPTVGAPVITSVVSASPANASVANNTPNVQQYACSCNYSDGVQRDCTSSATWQEIDNGGHATISVSGMLSTVGGASGSIIIECSYNSSFQSALATVN
jgi:hypothetical protein